jgi:two-component system, NarL family, response regulator NreC
MLPTKLLICDDHALYLNGLNLILDQHKAINISAIASSGKEIIEIVKTTDADILLLDLHLPDMDGLEITTQIRAFNKSLKIVVLTHQKGNRYLSKFKALNISGYVLKNISVEDLFEAITIIGNGGSYFSPDILMTSKEDEYYLKSSVIISEKNDLRLSDREKEILILVCNEMSSADIAKQLYLSTSTVDTHRKNILNKVGVSNTVGLVKYAIKHHLI